MLPRTKHLAVLALRAVAQRSSPISIAPRQTLVRFLASQSHRAHNTTNSDSNTATATTTAANSSPAGEGAPIAGAGSEAEGAAASTKTHTKDFEQELEQKLHKKHTTALAEKDAIIAAKDKRIAELQESVLRTMAEMQNVARRTKNDMAAAQKFALQSFAKSLLDVIDNLDRGRGQIEQWQAQNVAMPDEVKALLDGVLLTEKNLVKALEKEKIVKFPSLGVKADPNLHNIVFQVEDSTKEPGVIASVMKEGYMIHDRVLRTAMVGTYKKGAAPASPPPPTEPQTPSA